MSDKSSNKSDLNKKENQELKSEYKENKYDMALAYGIAFLIFAFAIASAISVLF